VTDVLIVGGGIGGLTLALELHKRGIACQVYESAPAIKAVGIGLITNVARLLAVMSGLTENRTRLRLRDTTALGWLSADESQGLVEAFELMWQVRLEHQSRRIERGLTPDDLVEPSELGPLTRQALKEAFRMIDRAQDRLAALLGIRR